MIITVRTGNIEKLITSAAVLLLFDEEKPGKTVERVDKALGGMIRRLIKQGDFRPKPGSVGIIYPEGKMNAERLVLAGLGKRKEFTLDRVRQAIGKAATYARGLGARDVAVVTDDLDINPEEAGQALVEGCMLGLYRFLKYKTNEDNDRKKEIQKLVIMTEGRASLKKLQIGAKTGEIIAGSTISARDMVSHPSSDMTPAIMAQKAREIAKKYRLKIRVLEKKDMQRLGMGALLGVAQGSAQPPKFIILEHRRGGRRPFIALVGKTITFDSGGISLKPPENMDRMKDDMSGGAAVLGAIGNAAALKLPLNVVALLPATENMPSGSAYKPGDVLTTMSGRTIEILSTDAEGRLILADALSYACKYRPEVIIDVATLTGACAIALGSEASGMLGNNDNFKQKMREAGEKTGERVWELPLWEGYIELIKSDIADMKNTGGRAGGVITAAALLSKFVNDHPWVHLDIAATSWTDKDRPYTPKGATGIGVRMLTQFLRDYTANSK